MLEYFKSFIQDLIATPTSSDIPIFKENVTDIYGLDYQLPAPEDFSSFTDIGNIAATHDM